MNDLLKIAGHFKPLESGGAPPGVPVYRYERADGKSVFYAPGLVAVAGRQRAEELQDALLRRKSPAFSLGTAVLASRIRDSARDASRRHRAFYRSAFQPECLTLYLQNQCNLDCTYCLRKSTAPTRKLSTEAVRRATAIVARNCRQRNRPMTVVIHGWGEPALDFALLQAVVHTVNSEARRAGLVPFRYIATNGVMAPPVAEYLSKNFDLVGLSCDGPPEIQDNQRRLPRGRSSRFVESTASLLRQNGTPISVRTTITRSTLKRQEEIARYILRELQPVEIHFEPVYRGRGAFAAEDAESFWKHFQKAQQLALRKGIPLTFSGSRPREIHGPYCHVFRNVLNLVPQDRATACFVEASGAGRTGIADRNSRRFTIDRQKVRKLKRTLARIPEACRHCVNGFHCAGACPDVCRLAPGSGSLPQTFRCRVQLLSTVSQILKCAKEIEQRAQPAGGIAWQTLDGPAGPGAKHSTLLEE